MSTEIKKYAIVDAKWAHGIFTELVKRYCLYTGENLKKELKTITAFDFGTYGGNIMAIVKFLGLSMCHMNIHETAPDQGEGINPESGNVIVTEFLNTQLLVELIQPEYERSKAQQELEALVTETGGLYLAVNGFADFYQQFGAAFQGRKSNNAVPR